MLRESIHKHDLAETSTNICVEFLSIQKSTKMFQSKALEKLKVHVANHLECSTQSEHE